MTPEMLRPGIPSVNEIEHLRDELSQAKAELSEAKSQLHTSFEWERLTKELEQAKDELSAWHSAFGTTQLSHAAEAYEKSKSENARLARETTCYQCGGPLKK